MLQPNASASAGGASVRRLAVLIVLAAVAACAHTREAVETDLTGTWSGGGSGQVETQAVPFVVTLDLVDAGGRISGAGEISTTEAAGHRSRPLQVTGTFQGGRAVLRLEIDGLGDHVFRGSAVAPDTLSGSLDLVLPSGIRPGRGSPYPVRVTLARAGASTD
jgi:hypothetical protein